MIDGQCRIDCTTAIPNAAPSVEVILIIDAVPAFSDGTLDTAVDSAGVAKNLILNL